MCCHSGVQYNHRSMRHAAMRFVYIIQFSDMIVYSKKSDLDETKTTVQVHVCMPYDWRPWSNLHVTLYIFCVCLFSPSQPRSMSRRWSLYHPLWQLMITKCVWHTLGSRTLHPSSSMWLYMWNICMLFHVKNNILSPPQLQMLKKV